MECTTGVRTAPMGARWTWNTLADSACSHHIPSLAPAVALPAPRHDRRRTGAAGSPPGGFPFVELTSRGCEMCGARALNSVHSRDSGNPAKAGSPLSRGRVEERILMHTEQIETRPRGLCWTVGT